MFTSLPPIDEKKHRQQQQLQYRRQLEAQIAEKAPVPGVKNQSQHPQPQPQQQHQQQPQNFQQRQNQYQQQQVVMHDHAAANNNVTPRNSNAVRNPSDNHSSNSSNSNNNIINYQQLELILGELSDMRQMIMTEVMPKVNHFDAMERKSNTSFRQLESLRAQVDMLTQSFYDSESERHASELNLSQAQRKDRDQQAQELHTLKLFLSAALGVGGQGDSSDNTSSNSNNSMVTNYDINSNGANIDTHMSLFARQHSLESNMTQEMSTLKRAVQDLKSRVASTHLLLLDSANNVSSTPTAPSLPANMMDDVNANANANANANSSSKGNNSNRRIVAADVLDTLSREIATLHTRTHTQDSAIASINTRLIDTHASIDTHTQVLSAQLDEMKTVLSAEITGRRKGQAKIQVHYFF